MAVFNTGSTTNKPLTSYLNPQAQAQAAKNNGLIDKLKPGVKAVVAKNNSTKATPKTTTAKVAPAKPTLPQNSTPLDALYNSVMGAGNAVAKTVNSALPKVTTPLDDLYNKVMGKPQVADTPVVKKPGIMDTLNKRVKEAFIIPERYPGESQSAYNLRMFQGENVAQAKRGLQETMKPEEVKTNVFRSLTSSVKDKPELSSFLNPGAKRLADRNQGMPLNEYAQPEKYTIESKKLFGQTQPITGRTVPSNDFGTNVSKFFLPRSQNEIMAEEVAKGGTQDEIARRVQSKGMEEGISNVIGMGGIKAVGSAATKTITKNILNADKTRMVEFIDNIRLKQPQNLDLELDASRIAEKYKIKMPATASGLANEFDRVLSGNKSFMSRLVKPVNFGLGIEEDTRFTKNPLVEEAKSAEEYFAKVKNESQTKTGKIYVNPTRSGHISIKSELNSVMDNQEEAIIESGAKILTTNRIPREMLEVKGNSLYPKDMSEVVNYAKENGYDIIRTEGDSRVINPNAIKTKSQLIEIWNKENKKPTLPKRTVEENEKAFLDSLDEKSYLPTTAKTSEKTLPQYAPRAAETNNLTNDTLFKPEIRMSGSENVYIKTGPKEAITNIPRDIQRNIFAYTNGENIGRSKLVETVNYLEGKGLRLVKNTTGEIGLARIEKRIEHISKTLPSASEINARRVAQNASEVRKTPNAIKDTLESKKSTLPHTSKQATYTQAPLDGSVKKGIMQKLKDNDAVAKINKAKQDLIKEDATVQPILQKHNTNLTVGRAQAQKAVNDFRNELKVKGIKDLSENITLHETGKAYPGRTLVEEKFTELYRQAQDLDIEFPLKENYLPHVYNESGREMTDAVEKALKSKGMKDEEIAAYLEGAELPPEIAKSLKMSPFFTKGRVFDTYLEAEKYGLTRKYDTTAQLIGHYTDELEKVKANRQLVADLLKNKQITMAPKYGDIPVLLPGKEGMYFAKPKTASLLNAVFRNEEGLDFIQKGIKATAWLSKSMQNVVLAGGAPFSSANFFSFGYIVKSLTTGLGNVTTIPFDVLLRGKRGALTDVRAASSQFKVLQNFMRSNHTPSAIKWFEERIDNGMLLKMARKDIDMSNVVGNFREVDRGWNNFFRKNTLPIKSADGIKKANGIAGLFSKSYEKVFGEKTFSSFLPMQTVSLFEDTYKSALKSGMAEEEALELAGKTTKLFSGFNNHVGGKTMQDAKSAVFFAPRFREGLINVYSNSLKSVLDPRNWKKLEYAQNRKLLVGMAITFFGGYDYLNMKLNGHHMWENPTGKEMNLMVPGKDGKITYVPFMPSQLAFFRNMVEGGFAFKKGDTETAQKKVMSLASMPVQAFTAVSSNEDYFGNPIRDKDTSLWDQFWSVTGYLNENYDHPYVQAVIDTSKQINAEKQPIYPTYIKIKGLIDSGDRETADKLLNSLSEEDQKAYQDMKKLKMKPLDQVLVKMLEIPLTYGSVGSIQSQEFFKKTDEIKRAIKATPEEKRSDKIQEYITAADEDDRKGLLYALQQDGIDTTGVSTSSDIIRMKPTYNNIQELVKSGKKDEALKIVQAMNKEDYEAYKKVKSSARAKITKQFKNKLDYDPVDAVKFLRGMEDKDLQASILKNMDKEEYAQYQEGKKGL